jgi:hypothetical protein
VYLAKSFRGKEWRYLSIAPGQSDTYRKNPVSDSATGQQTVLARQTKGG